MNLKGLMVFWPAGVAMVVAIAMGSDVKSSVANHETRLQQMETNRLQVLERLARLEQTAQDTNSRTMRIEQKLDRLGQ